MLILISILQWCTFWCPLSSYNLKVTHFCPWPKGHFFYHVLNRWLCKCCSGKKKEPNKTETSSLLDNQPCKTFKKRKKSNKAIKPFVIQLCWWKLPVSLSSYKNVFEYHKMWIKYISSIFQVWLCFIKSLLNFTFKMNELDNPLFSWIVDISAL